MSSSDRVRDNPAALRQETTPAGAANTAADPYANWLDRMQRARVRHAAITRNLYTWANYKNWADRVKGSWEDGNPEAEPPKPGQTPSR